MKTIQKGEIIETTIANEISMKSDGELIAYRPIVDLGVDLIIDMKERFNPVFIQIKSRDATKSDRFSNFWNKSLINKSTKISFHKRFYLLFLRVDYNTCSVKNLWFIPSNYYGKIVNKKTTNKYKCTVDGLIKKLRELIQSDAYFTERR